MNKIVVLGFRDMVIQSIERSVEERLAAMEAAIVDLRRQLMVDPRPGNWLEKISGEFKDDPVFEEMLRLGREYRLSDYPDYCKQGNLS